MKERENKDKQRGPVMAQIKALPKMWTIQLIADKGQTKNLLSIRFAKNNTNERRTKAG